MKIPIPSSFNQFVKSYAAAINRLIEIEEVYLDYTGLPYWSSSGQYVDRSGDVHCNEDTDKSYNPTPPDPTIVHVEDVEYLQKQLNDIDKLNFKDIKWYRNGEPLRLSKETIEGWKFVGLSNTAWVDFGEANVNFDIEKCTTNQDLYDLVEKSKSTDLYEDSAIDLVFEKYGLIQNRWLYDELEPEKLTPAVICSILTIFSINEITHEFKDRAVEHLRKTYKGNVDKLLEGLL